MSSAGVAAIAGKSGKNITNDAYAAKDAALKQSGVDLNDKLNATGVYNKLAPEDTWASATQAMDNLGTKIAGDDQAFIDEVGGDGEGMQGGRRGGRGEGEGEREKRVKACAPARPHRPPLTAAPHPTPHHSSTPSSTSTTSR